jgi:3-dehydrotetronate 4-kinase
MPVLLGAIADDFTGATDLCNTLVRRGMKTVQLIGTPPAGATVPDAEAVVVALKSRTIPAGEAVSMSLEALDWLRAAGARQILFKYCSTFDSTPQGNIGPVAEALLDALGADPVSGHGAGFTLYCPAFPEAGRTIFNGYLFVGDALLSESGMKDHPLTPMRDPSLVRVLQAQCRGRVGLVQHAIVARGPAAIAEAFAGLRRAGFRHAIVDAIADHDLEAIGAAASDLPLITGGSGIALGLPENFRSRGLIGDGGAADHLPKIGGKAAVLSGSCSEATQAQVAHMINGGYSGGDFIVNPLVAAVREDFAAEALAWADEQPGDKPLLFASTAGPKLVARVQQELGRERAGAVVERVMAEIAQGLVERGVRRLVVAGGETAGAVVQALGVTGLRIGRQIDPGVPWTTSLGEPPLALALKSGNFGAPDFFQRAFDVLDRTVR